MFADNQDGYGVGQLSNMAVNGNGDIQGFYSNGQIRVLGSVGASSSTSPKSLPTGGS